MTRTYAFSFAGVIACFFWLVFRETPFLQHELVGQAYIWIRKGTSFFSLLFDSEIMDCAPGRFRYIEYLWQALYWKATQARLLPIDFYDYGAIAAALGSVFLIWKIGEVKKLRPLDIFLIATVFLLSTQVHMTAVFNFRKAKFFVSFYFLLMIYLSLRGMPVRRKTIAFLVLSAVGFLTDPYFILLSPLVALGIDISQRNRDLRTLKTTFAGLLAGFVGTFILTDAIGPFFSHSSRLIFTSIPGKPVTFLEIANFPFFANILADIVAPFLFGKSYPYLGYGLFILAYCLFVWMLRARWKEYGYFITFLLSLPVGAFCLLPTREFAYFSGYYGHTFLVLFLLAMTEIIPFLRSRGQAAVAAAHVFLLLCVVCHQIAKPDVFKKWREVYSDSEQVREKVTRDYQELKSIQAHLKKDLKDPYELVLDFSEIDRLFLSKGQYFDDGGRFDRTYIAYLLIPTFYEKEINAGKIRIVAE